MGSANGSARAGWRRPSSKARTFFGELLIEVADVYRLAWWDVHRGAVERASSRSRLKKEKEKGTPGGVTYGTETGLRPVLYPQKSVKVGVGGPEVQ